MLKGFAAHLDVRPFSARVPRHRVRAVHQTRRVGKVEVLRKAALSEPHQGAIHIAEMPSVSEAVVGDRGRILKNACAPARFQQEPAHEFTVDVVLFDIVQQPRQGWLRDHPPPRTDCAQLPRERLRRFEQPLGPSFDLRREQQDEEQHRIETDVASRLSSNSQPSHDLVQDPKLAKAHDNQNVLHRPVRNAVRVSYTCSDICLLPRHDLALPGRLALASPGTPVVPGSGRNWPPNL